MHFAGCTMLLSADGRFSSDTAVYAVILAAIALLVVLVSVMTSIVIGMDTANVMVLSSVSATALFLVGLFAVRKVC